MAIVDFTDDLIRFRGYSTRLVKKYGLACSAEDIEQEAALRLLRADAWERFDAQPLQRAAYVRKALRSAALDLFRRRLRRVNLVQFPEGNEVAPELKTGRLPPNEIAAAIEIVSIARSRLSPLALFALAVALDLDSTEAYANRNGCHVRTAQRHFSDGISDLRLHIAEVVTELYGERAYAEFMQDVALAHFHSRHGPAS